MSRKTSKYARSRGLLSLPPEHRYAATEARKGNGLQRNNQMNTLLTEDEVQRLLADPRRAMTAMRTGHGTYNDLVSLNSAVKKGVAIEDARVIIRGFQPIYDAATNALRTIEDRATRTGRWVPTALYASELNALDDLLFAYEQAIRVCTYGEFFQRQATAIARTASDGQPVYTVGDVVEYQPS